mmetsp:Transcript_88968/g.281573  ORF Transcript_88968/g.281573 Transcript_88968/m.281573 type:complete len:301 (-) Transcript_88968:161-1063(-)
MPRNGLCHKAGDLAVSSHTKHHWIRHERLCSGGDAANAGAAEGLGQPELAGPGLLAAPQFLPRPELADDPRRSRLTRRQIRARRLLRSLRRGALVAGLQSSPRTSRFGRFASAIPRAHLCEDSVLQRMSDAILELRGHAILADRRGSRPRGRELDLRRSTAVKSQAHDPEAGVAGRGRRARARELRLDGSSAVGLETCDRQVRAAGRRGRPRAGELGLRGSSVVGSGLCACQALAAWRGCRLHEGELSRRRSSIAVFMLGESGTIGARPWIRHCVQQPSWSGNSAAFAALCQRGAPLARV